MIAKNLCGLLKIGMFMSLLLQTGLVQADTCASNALLGTSASEDKIRSELEQMKEFIKDPLTDYSSFRQEVSDRLSVLLQKRQFIQEGYQAYAPESVTPALVRSQRVALIYKNRGDLRHSSISGQVHDVITD